MNKQFIVVVTAIVVGVGLYVLSHEESSDPAGSNNSSAKVVISGSGLVDQGINEITRGKCAEASGTVIYSYKTSQYEVTMTSSLKPGGDRTSSFHVHTTKAEIYSPDEAQVPKFDGQWQVNPDCKLATLRGRVSKDGSAGAERLGNIDIAVGKDSS